MKIINFYIGRFIIIWWEKRKILIFYDWLIFWLMFFLGCWKWIVYLYWFGLIVDREFGYWFGKGLVW